MSNRSRSQAGPHADTHDRSRVHAVCKLVHRIPKLVRLASLHFGKEAEPPAQGMDTAGSCMDFTQVSRGEQAGSQFFTILCVASPPQQFAITSLR
jgi:hypothetical protein